MSDLKNLSGSINFDALKNFQPSYSTELANNIQREHERSMRIIQEAREEKEAEELRRHNELIEALKTAGENGATIIVGDNANGIQIQQNSSGSSQEMVNTQIFNYDKALDVLKEIQGYVGFPQFQETFKENTENMQSIIEETIRAVEIKQEPSLIKKSLSILRDLAIEAGGSLIASGILALLATIPM